MKPYVLGGLLWIKSPDELQARSRRLSDSDDSISSVDLEEYIPSVVKKI